VEEGGRRDPGVTNDALRRLTQKKKGGNRGYINRSFHKCPGRSKRGDRRLGATKKAKRNILGRQVTDLYKGDGGRTEKGGVQDGVKKETERTPG